ncbi:MAG: uracil-DNA glycosylase [Oceanospirillaceae bacterium]|nr:uracil-DNA glycosylase [Oceanospirillaceae bacterium]MAX99179.1 uracil-DNA glycosylase [Oceanospirillaceae bacterium]MBL33684.1 uracil-DNA glycosylase [Oceanospirillaceae bacterium]MBS51682.1 uracil-DNA glycosylase [Oceanospirillaceae bacterium]
MKESGVGKAGELHPSWQAVLGQEFEQPYMHTLREFLQQEKAAGKVIFPPGPQIFNAFNHTPFDQVRVVIIGQDPYHGPGQAHGLSFSVQPGVKVPPSLVNIFKEIQADLGLQMSGSGDLTPWADQGVLLLNATLTVEQANAGSHQKKGWEEFTDAAIKALNEQRSGLVFVLWGSYAQKKGAVIDQQRHMVLKSPHPSPLSAHRGFFGNHQFSAINQYLLKQGQQPINWQI